ncbi:3-oxo-tetronate kinase [Roseibium litorale]|uniref:3-oxo-tetronate kinase n=1 Tax=Roseibium litorale TaxID=2803841 RepID=A0ABR9CM77_9HYPH|nr:3-oxo-tetronate kinase [Roseibium litorale]MBD8891949.1 four-carbon acid sugar kinase family protein [Roseibium litorale]
MKLGAIGDDFTGSSDLGLTLAQGGMRTVQYVGVPGKPAAADVDAGIIALKSRSIPADEAVKQSLDALRWLQEQGCKQIVFKYCSTFDSMPEGNIGPVIEALIDALETDAPVIVCPAFPATGRTVYQGHLFVHDKLLSESGMEHHPLNPMTDPDLRRFLARQTKRPVGHLALAAIQSGQARKTLLDEAEAGRQIIVCDAVSNQDLLILGEAARGFPLVTGGSGIGLGLPSVLRADEREPAKWSGVSGPALALSGSCSAATRNQIAVHRAEGGAQRKVEVEEIIGGLTPAELLDWAESCGGLPLIYSSDDPHSVKAAQNRFGQDRCAEAVEGFFANLASQALERGFTRIISAGGETSGAVVRAVDATALRIGPMIDPGVPAVKIEGRKVALALKSGNFGAEDFFIKAARVLEGK